MTLVYRASEDFDVVGAGKMGNGVPQTGTN